MKPKNLSIKEIPAPQCFIYDNKFIIWLFIVVHFSIAWLLQEVLIWLYWNIIVLSNRETRMMIKKAKQAEKAKSLNWYSFLIFLISPKKYPNVDEESNV